MNWPAFDAAFITSLGAFITAFTLAGKQLIEWYRDRKNEREMQGATPARVDSVIAQSADAAVVALSKTVDSLQDENSRLSARVRDLELALSQRDQKIEQLETRLRRAEHELRSVADELAIMKNHN